MFDVLCEKQLSDGGTVNLLSKSYNYYNINEMGLQKCILYAKEKRQQLHNEIRTLCEAPRYQGLPDSGQISIALEYVDGGSLADVIRIRKSIPEPFLSAMVHKLSCRIGYLDMFKVVELTCDKHRSELVESPLLEEIVHHDLWARDYASGLQLTPALA